MSYLIGYFNGQTITHPALSISLGVGIIFFQHFCDQISCFPRFVFFFREKNRVVTSPCKQNRLRESKRMILRSSYKCKHDEPKFSRKKFDLCETMKMDLDYK